MPFDTILTFIGIFAAAVWTPGPNNAMLAASGATFGFRRTLPHVLGVAWGFGLMLLVVGLGVGAVFETVPILKDILLYAGIALLIWVAWKIATMRAPGEAGAESRPFTFLQASAFQWVNPKAWAMCLSMASVFVRQESVVWDALLISFLSCLIGMTSACGWTGFGHAMQRVLAGPGRLRAFNFLMAATILLGVVYLIIKGVDW